MVTRVPPVAISIDVRAFELPASTKVSAARRRVPAGSAARESSRAAPLPAQPEAQAQAMSTAATKADPPACLSCRSAIAAHPQPIRP